MKRQGEGVEPRSHWDRVYAAKDAAEVTWYQPHHAMSLQLIAETGVGASTSIIDVGGGTSTLVDDLLERGFTRLTVLDVSPVAIDHAKKRLGSRASEITWLEADVTQAELPPGGYDLWHDRAVFHFLTLPEQRAAYVVAVARALKPGGHLVLSTFGPEGPRSCSGLEVVRYSPDSLLRELGDGFELLKSVTEQHRAPSGARQQFVYCHFRNVGGAL